MNPEELKAAAPFIKATVSKDVFLNAVNEAYRDGVEAGIAAVLDLVEGITHGNYTADAFRVRINREKDACNHNP